MNNGGLFRLAVAQYGVAAVQSFKDFEAKVRNFLDEATENGAELILLPEYFSMELASLAVQKLCAAPDFGVATVQKYREPFIKFFSEEAKKRGIYICAGSFIVVEAGKTFNRCYCFSANGAVQHQDKLMMTRFESEDWCVNEGVGGQTLWRLPWGNAGIAICYDIEFPMIARRLVDNGAQLILCPSCTDSDHGYHRVRTGCLARALENQCIVAQSVTVGDCDWSEVIDQNCGAAGIYGPMDKGYPSDGVIAQGEYDVAMWVYADIDLGLINDVRANGAVLNYRDWHKQF